MSEPHDVIKGWGDYLQFLDEDKKAHNIGKWMPWMKYKYPQFHYQRALRYVELLSNYSNPVGRVMWVLARVRLARLGISYGLSIPPGVFGRGLSIAHIGNIVVNNRARLGRNCRIHSGTNIGEYAGAAPSVGNNVYIGPGAVLFGAIRVGEGSVIGANAVVTRSVPSGVIVAGAPARVIREVNGDTPMPMWMRSTSPALHNDGTSQV